MYTKNLTLAFLGNPEPTYIGHYCTIFPFQEHCFDSKRGVGHVNTCFYTIQEGNKNYVCDGRAQKFE